MQSLILILCLYVTKHLKVEIKTLQDWRLLEAFSNRGDFSHHSAWQDYSHWRTGWAPSDGEFTASSSLFNSLNSYWKSFSHSNNCPNCSKANGSNEKSLFPQHGSLSKIQTLLLYTQVLFHSKPNTPTSFKCFLVTYFPDPPPSIFPFSFWSSPVSMVLSECDI